MMMMMITLGQPYPAEMNLYSVFDALVWKLSPEGTTLWAVGEEGSCLGGGDIILTHTHTHTHTHHSLYRYEYIKLGVYYTYSFGGARTERRVEDEPDLGCRGRRHRRGRPARRGEPRQQAAGRCHQSSSSDHQSSSVIISHHQVIIRHHQ